MYEKCFDVRTDRWQWKIRKTVYKMISGNKKNRDDELVQHLNCHAKQSAIEGSDLKDHEIQEMSGKRSGSNTQYFLLTQSNSIIRGYL